MSASLAVAAPRKSLSSTWLRLAFSAGLGLALTASGGAALVNQVVWQRSLGRLLGGSETIASMTVVLVFMAGLGMGSIWMGRRCGRKVDPLRALGLVELALGFVNFLIAGFFYLDLSQTIFAAQKMAAAVGLPLLAFYALGAAVVLTVPCFLMGATMPLAAEVCQRRFGWQDSRVLGMLMFLNTLGSVGGAVLGGGYLMPRYGQTASLLLAVGLNGAAGLCALSLAVSRQGSGFRVQGSEEARRTSNIEHRTLNIEREGAESSTLGVGRSMFNVQHDLGILNPEPRTLNPHRVYEILALGLGFCSLGYEMFLLRLFPLLHQPLPFTFSAVITGFLLFWSVGAALSSRGRFTLTTALRTCAFAIVATLLCSRFDQPEPIVDLSTLSWFVASRSFYFLPALAFGYLFGAVTAQAARSWGHDVGRIYAWNTVGSCLGIVLMTLVGYEMPYFMMAFALVPLLFALEEYYKGSGFRVQGSGEDKRTSNIEHRTSNVESERLERSTLDVRCSMFNVQHDPGVLNPEPRTLNPLSRYRRCALALAACGAVVACGLLLDMSFLTPNLRVFYGRDGVIAVQQPERHMFWDGLWHSRLTDGKDHIGTYNWFLATCPVMVHGTGQIEDCCVIGLGLGITAGTLAKLDTVKTVDAYEFNHTLKKVYRRFPDGTLRLLENPKINVIWQDARSGMSLRDKKYDVIQTQPLYLKQSGSSQLNSLEFFRLVSRRLKPGGIFCLYSNGTPEQALVVRQTAAQVFRGRETFMNGYLLVLSNEPIRLDETALAQRLGSRDALWQEIAGCERTRDVPAILAVMDRPALPWGDGRLLVTDDRPIIEYPAFLEEAFRRLGHSVPLPKPGLTVAD